MRIHYIIHAPFEKLGVIEAWIEKHNYSSNGTYTFRGETLPHTSEFDMLILMGGPQSLIRLDEYPYLRDEIKLTKQAVKDNKAVLGICLGAQILSEALGAKTEHSPHKEIGIHPIHLTQAAKEDPLFKHFPSAFDVMHWHSDMPGMPQNSLLLANSVGCPRQAFSYNDRVYGFQFHMEMTPDLMRNMVKHCEEDITVSPYVQPADKLLQLDFTSINQKLYLTLDYLVERIQSNK